MVKVKTRYPSVTLCKTEGSLGNSQRRKKCAIAPSRLFVWTYIFYFGLLSWHNIMSTQLHVSNEFSSLKPSTGTDPALLLFPVVPRLFHVDECGLHSRHESCDAGPAVRAIEMNLVNYESGMFQLPQNAEIAEGGSAHPAPVKKMRSSSRP